MTPARLIAVCTAKMPPILEYTGMRRTGAKRDAATVANGPISTEAIRDRLGDVGWQRQTRPAGELGRTDHRDALSIPVEIPKRKTEDFATAQVQPRKQQHHCVFAAPDWCLAQVMSANPVGVQCFASKGDHCEKLEALLRACRVLIGAVNLS